MAKAYTETLLHDRDYPEGSLMTYSRSLPLQVKHTWRLSWKTKVLLMATLIAY